MNPETALALDWFVVDSNRRTTIVHGIQTVADTLHHAWCNCGGIRWIDCGRENVKSQIQRLFEIENWNLDLHRQPFRWDSSSIFPPTRVIHVSGLIERKENRDAPTLHFLVPLLPPSVNHYKQPNKGGGYRVSKEARAFIDAVAIFARSAAAPTWPWMLKTQKKHSPFYEVDLIFRIHQPRFLIVDSDNFEKVAFDALTHCAAISDDRYIKYHTNRAIPVEEKCDEKTEYTITITEKPE